MHETEEELASLQQVLDETMESAGPHLRSIISPERRLSAAELVERLQGMCLLAVASVTSDGRPLLAPVDGYLLHGCFHFSSGREAVKMRHLARRPAVSALHLPGEELSVAVHGRAELYDVNDPARPELRRAMLEHYLPVQGRAFEEWLDAESPRAARILPEKMVTFRLGS